MDAEAMNSPNTDAARSPTGPLVSVVVPCYNVEDCVEATVVSALEQTHAPLEVICVDDGSSDGTVDILQRLQAADGRVRIIEGDHAGAPAARNKGLATALGEYVQFLDSDDLLLPEKVGHQVALAQAAAADLVAGAFVRLSDSGSRSPRGVGEDAWTALVWSQMGVTSADLWRRSAVLAAGGWKEGQHSSQEYELMFRMLCNGARVAFDHTALTEKIHRDGSISAAHDAPVRESYLRLCIDVLEHLETVDALTRPRRQRILDSILLKVRTLYPYDREAALRYYRCAIPWTFLPSPGSENALSFVLLSKVVGLDLAERLRALKP